MNDFSDYIVYVDESGDHSLVSIDPQFPVFALSFCVVKKADYAASVVPAMQSFKFKYWGHDAVVLHEHEIRKTIGDFAFLRTDPAKRAAFYSDLNGIMVDAPVAIVAAAIGKAAHAARYSDPWNPYDVALYFCLERLHSFLTRNGQSGKRTHIVFEKRGKAEDRALALTFDRIVSGDLIWGYRQIAFSTMTLEARFATKAINSTGLQLADLTARPIALKSLRPDQANRAYDIIATKEGAIKFFP